MRLAMLRNMLAHNYKKKIMTHAIRNNEWYWIIDTAKYTKENADKEICIMSQK